jgi:nucleoid-associated protein EbfC
MFDKLFQAQQQVEEIKKRLDSVSVTGEAEGGLIRVIATANKEIKSIQVDPDFFAEGDREALEELLVVATNKALQQAEQISQAEMQSATKDMLGGLGSMFGQP